MNVVWACIVVVDIRVMDDFFKHSEYMYNTHVHLLGGQEGCLGVFND